MLDCSYSIDKSEEKSFALKWYFGNQSEVIYHWMPDLDFRFVNGRIQAKFDWDFYLNTTNPKVNKFRAIIIKRPTTEQSGLYICEVSTNQGTDSKSASMIIYSPPEEVDFSRKFLEKEKQLLMSYKVKRIFPLPFVVIYQSCGNKRFAQRTTLLHDTSAISNDARAESGKENVYTLENVQYISFTDIIANHLKNGCTDDDDVAYYGTIELMLTINSTDYIVEKSFDIILRK
ncbi:uncharacterized protein B4U79_10043 [Dinothrombium tinctorium]|uniref:Ig-like domain-containing protein n=1 Tax=Dinothrombium tinctorium TaxID=1965070 RepID=A0A3S4RIT2_9ACAR|nr:uncharacterized protein B4U79_10043 [Dinothrombium tinctorium]